MQKYHSQYQHEYCWIRTTGKGIEITGQKIEFTEAGSTLVDIRVVLLIVTLITIGIFYFSTVLRKRHVVLLGILSIIFYLVGVINAQKVLTIINKLRNYDEYKSKMEQIITNLEKDDRG